MRMFRAWWALTWFSFRRQLWSSATMMVLLPLIAGALFLMRRNFDAMEHFPTAFERFSQFLSLAFVNFLVPICALAYGATSLGADREERTLAFLFARPMPRWLILWGKFSASFPLGVGIILGSFFLYCSLAGKPGEAAFPLYLPGVFGMAVAYICLFHLFSVLFRHATIVSLVYCLFIELLLGTMPGIIKRIAINYYGRSLMFSGGAVEGLTPPDPRWFEPLSPAEAIWTLGGISVASLLLALVLFQRREYSDLT